MLLNDNHSGISASRRSSKISFFFFAVFGAELKLRHLSLVFESLLPVIFNIQTEEGKTNLFPKDTAMEVFSGSLSQSIYTVFVLGPF